MFDSFSGSIFEPIFEQILNPFWADFWLMFGSKLAPKAEHFYKAFLESSWSHLESRLGPPGSLLRGLMFQKHCKNRVQMHVRKNASWPRVTSPGPPSKAKSLLLGFLLSSRLSLVPPGSLQLSFLTPGSSGSTGSPWPPWLPRSILQLWQLESAQLRFLPD